MPFLPPVPYHDRVRRAALLWAWLVAGPTFVAGQEVGQSRADQTPRLAIAEFESAPAPFVSGTAEVWDVAISGELIATSGDDGNVRLYDRSSRELLLVKPCHAAAVSSLAFSPDGSLLATGGYDQTVKVWQVPSLQLQSTWSGHTGQVLCVAFAPDGKRVASCGYDGTLRVWQVATGEVKTIPGDGSTVRGVTYSADGSTLVSGGDDAKVRLWDAQTLQVTAVLDGHTARVRAVACAPSGDVLASVGEDGAARLWDRRQGKLIREIREMGAAWRLAFSCRGAVLAIGYQDGAIRLFDASNGKKMAERTNHIDTVSALAFLPDDVAYYSASYDGSVLAWPALLPAHATVARLATEQKVWAASVSASGRQFAVAGRKGFAQIRDFQNGQVVHELPAHEATIDRIEFSPDGSLVATAGWRSAEVNVWQTADGAKQQSFEAPSNVRALAFSPDGQRLTVACTGRELTTWRLADGQRVASVTAHKLPVYDVAYSPDGETLLTCSGDWSKPLPGVVKFWAADSLSEIAALEGHTSAVHAATFRPDGRQVASASQQGVIKIWDVATNTELASLQNSAGIRDLAYSSDGKLIAAALQDGTINLWNLDREEVVCRLRGDDDVFSVCFAADDSVVCAAGGERRILFWDLSKLRAGPTATWVQAWTYDDQQE